MPSRQDQFPKLHNPFHSGSFVRVGWTTFVIRFDHSDLTFIEARLGQRENGVSIIGFSQPSFYEPFRKFPPWHKIFERGTRDGFSNLERIQ